MRNSGYCLVGAPSWRAKRDVAGQVGPRVRQWVEDAIDWLTGRLMPMLVMPRMRMRLLLYSIVLFGWPEWS